MKRKPARLKNAPAAPPPCRSRFETCPPAPTPGAGSAPPDFHTLFPEPPPLEVIYAALDRISEEWGIKL